MLSTSDITDILLDDEVLSNIDHFTKNPNEIRFLTHSYGGVLHTGRAVKKTELELQRYRAGLSPGGDLHISAEDAQYLRAHSLRELEPFFIGTGLGPKIQDERRRVDRLALIKCQLNEADYEAAKSLAAITRVLPTEFDKGGHSSDYFDLNHLRLLCENALFVRCEREDPKSNEVKLLVMQQYRPIEDWTNVLSFSYGHIVAILGKNPKLREAIKRVYVKHSGTIDIGSKAVELREAL